MERLTKHWGNNYVPTKLNLDIMLTTSNEQADRLMDIVKKLADYEDAEEQGLLLRLPCKVGDTIYKIPSKTNYDLNILNGFEFLNKVYEQKVYSITITSLGYGLTTCNGQDGVVSDTYKETWFLTKEEAEQKLASMQKG